MSTDGIIKSFFFGHILFILKTTCVQKEIGSVQTDCNVSMKKDYVMVIATVRTNQTNRYKFAKVKYIYNNKTNIFVGLNRKRMGSN